MARTFHHAPAPAPGERSPDGRRVGAFGRWFERTQLEELADVGPYDPADPAHWTALERSRRRRGAGGAR